jgi:hypothetical protein
MQEKGNEIFILYGMKKKEPNIYYNFVNEIPISYEIIFFRRISQ